MLTPH
jgi:hypothetical protein